MEKESIVRPVYERSVDGARATGKARRQIEFRGISCRYMQIGTE